jgi:hypothetical protein
MRRKRRRIEREGGRWTVEGRKTRDEGRETRTRNEGEGDQRRRETREIEIKMKSTRNVLCDGR